MKFEKNGQLATQTDISKFRKNSDSLKAQGLRLVREQGNWLIIDLNKFVSQAFWSAWRTKKEALKEAGYRVARAYDHWIVY